MPDDFFKKGDKLSAKKFNEVLSQFSVKNSTTPVAGGVVSNGRVSFFGGRNRQSNISPGMVKTCTVATWDDSQKKLTLGEIIAYAFKESVAGVRDIDTNTEIKLPYWFTEQIFPGAFISWAEFENEENFILTLTCEPITGFTAW